MDDFGVRPLGDSASHQAENSPRHDSMFPVSIGGELAKASLSQVGLTIPTSEKKIPFSQTSRKVNLLMGKNLDSAASQLKDKGLRDSNLMLRSIIPTSGEILTIWMPRGRRRRPPRICWVEENKDVQVFVWRKWLGMIQGKISEDDW
ncbi:hypothetical protein AKJ16_DCAP16999 [Drosera capensis]